MNEQDLKDLLTRELKPVKAPADLWARIETARTRPPAALRPQLWIWAVPVLALAASVCFAIFHTLVLPSPDLGGTGGRAAAVENVPVYEISQARTTMIAGEPVRHLVFTPEDRSEDISLFISASRLRLPEQRGPQVRSVQFPCSKQMCTVVCRKCSARAVEVLSAQLAVETPHYQ